MKQKRSTLLWVLGGLLGLGILIGISIPNLLRSKMTSFYSPEGKTQHVTTQMSEVGDATLREVSLQDAPVERMLIRTAEMSLQVKDLRSARQECNALVSELGGYIEESSIYDESEHASSASLKLRVPANHLDESMNRLRKLAVRVDRENITAKDVTREYIDLDSRLRNLQAEEQQYLVILKRASTVKDTLDVTQHLSEVRGQIEQMQAQLKYLSHQVEMSSISVNLYMKSAATLSTIQWAPALTARNAFHDMLEGLAGWADSILSFLIELPLILLWVFTVGVVIVIVWKPLRFLWRRFRKTQASPEPAQGD